MNKADLIVALDVPNAEAMEAKLQELPDFIEWYKVGLEIFCAEGPRVLEPLKKRGKKIFLDLKLHDIPQTVANAVKTAASHGVNLMTVHAVGGRAMLEAAANAAKECENPPKIVAVTTLTSLSAEDFIDLGINRTVSEQAVALGRLAISSGIDGMVTSAHEAQVLRAEFPEAILVTPGIRLPDGDIGDQKRVASPSFAVEQGATHLVIGRPIMHSEDPTAAAIAMLEDMNK
ncbi:MAG: orotidine-5'-phosphate decarboxylase [Pontiella sp.]